MGGAERGSGRDRGYSGRGEAKRVREVFPIALICPGKDNQEGVSVGLSGMKVAGVVDAASVGSGGSERNDL